MEWFKIGFGIVSIIVLLLLASILNQYTPEEKKAKNKTNTTYTMIVNGIETVSKPSSDNKNVTQTVYIDHDHNKLIAETPLTINKHDEIKYQYVDDVNNKIKILQVTHFK